MHLDQTGSLIEMGNKSRTVVAAYPDGVPATGGRSYALHRLTSSLNDQGDESTSDVHWAWKRTVRGWATILFLCLLGAVATLGLRTLLETVGSVKHTRYEPADVLPSSVSLQHERKRQELERRDHIVLEKGK